MSRYKEASPKYEKEKRERFTRVASLRTNRIINDLELLGNCSSTRNYGYSEADVAAIFNTIEDKLKEVRQLYSSRVKPFALEVLEEGACENAVE